MPQKGGVFGAPACKIDLIFAIAPLLSTAATTTTIKTTDQRTIGGIIVRNTPDSRAAAARMGSFLNFVKRLGCRSSTVLILEAFKART